MNLLGNESTRLFPPSYQPLSSTFPSLSFLPSVSPPSFLPTLPPLLPFLFPSSPPSSLPHTRVSSFTRVPLTPAVHSSTKARGRNHTLPTVFTQGGGKISLLSCKNTPRVHLLPPLSASSLSCQHPLAQITEGRAAAE